MIRLPWFLALLLGAGIASAAGALGAAPPDSDGMSLRMQACTPCHGKEGRATNDGYFPRIAGKPSGYLYAQLLNFREGRRGNPAMGHLVQHLSDGYLREIADWFAVQDLPYPPPQTRGGDPALLTRGRQLAQQGDPARGLPGCTTCHGAALMGALPGMPGLLGLPRDYLLAQLGAWKTGQRHAVAPDCMRQVAQRLSDADASALALWLSSTPVPSDPRPDPALVMPLPLECGSGVR